MTRDVLPPLAANIQDAVSKGSYNAATVRTLEQILHSGHARASIIAKQQVSVRCSQAQATTTRAAKATGNGRRKQAPVAVLEDGTDDVLLSPREKYNLATDVVNNSLKVLTSTVQSSVQPPAKLGGTLSRTPSVPAASRDSGIDLELPLRSLCINQVTDTVQGKCRSPRSSMVSSKENPSVLLAVAKCGSIAFAILRSVDGLKNSGVQMPYLQLEQGMSVFTGKLIALGLYELAIEELHSLKIRLDTPASTLTQEKRDPRPRSKDSNKVPLVSSKETLPDLLKFQNNQANGQLLSLIITFQLHVLRIIAARGRFNDLEAATKHLDLDRPFSPAKFIEQQIEQRSPQASVKAGQQMESFSRLLFQLCATTKMEQQHPATKNSMCPSVALQYCALALQTRLKWWKMANHQGDALSDIVRPFDLYLSSFRRSSSVTEKEKYLVSQGHVRDLVKDLLCLRGEAGVRNVERAISKLQLTVAIVAQECSQFQDAVHWMHESRKYLLLAHAPKSQICTFMCRQASLTLRSQSADGNRQQMVCELKDVANILSQDLGTCAEELVETVTALNVFRKSVLATVQKHHLKQQVDGLEVNFLVQTSIALCSAISFLSRLYSRIELPNDGAMRTEPGLSIRQLVRDVLDPFIDSFAMLAKLSTNCSPEDWVLIEAGLQSSLTLTQRSKFGDQNKEHEAKERSRSSSSILSISTAYWCRFLNQKQRCASRPELQSLLASSIKAVKDQPTLVQDAAFLSAKLERMASSYESSSDYSRALGAYKSIVEFLIANKSVSSAAEAAGTNSLEIVFKSNPACGLLSRSILGYLNAVHDEGTEARSPSSILDFGELPISQRGVILEHQLTAIRSIIDLRGCSPKVLQTIKQLASTLLSIYSEDGYPIRRLRVSVKLLQLQSDYSLELGQELIEQLSQVGTTEGQDPCLRHDEDLKQYEKHLRARRDMYMEFSSKEADPERLNNLLAISHNILQATNDWTALQTCVDDVADWLIQLNALEQSLELQGLEHERISTIQLLVRLYEMADPVRAIDLITKLTALGVQYARLGYSGNAGLIFQRAYRYTSATTVPAPYITDLHLAYAQYFLGIGNYEKSESYLNSAQDLFLHDDHKRLGKQQIIQLTSNAASVYAQLSATKGDFSQALFFCRLRVKLLHRLWSRSEERSSGTSNNKALHNLGGEVEQITKSMTSLSITKLWTPAAGATEHSNVDIHSLIFQLFCALIDLGDVYAHEGLFSESQYYMEQSAKILDNASSTALKTRYHTRLGQYLVRGGKMQSGTSHLYTAEALLNSAKPNGHAIEIQLALSEMYVKSKKFTSAMSALTLADTILEKMMQENLNDGFSPKHSNTLVLETSINTPTGVPPPNKSRTMCKSKAAINKRAKVPRAATAKPRSTEPAALQCTRARLMRRQASIALQEGDFDRVEFLLQKAVQPFATPLDHIMHTSLTAKVALGRALASMTSDLVFCVIPESTTCCPAIRANIHCHDNSSDEETEELLDRSVPTRSKTSRLNSKPSKVLRMTAIPGFVELLSQCQDDFSKMRSLVVSAGSTVDLHTFVDMSMRTAMMLSAFPLSGAKSVQSPLLAMYVIEIGRTSATNKQHQALCNERQISLTRNPENWPANDVVLTQPHQLIPSDLASFQSQYLDIIPSSWTVFSLTLSESRDEIRITKFRPHHGPFILNLPLGRRSQDGDEEPFGFEQGKAELGDIVTLANYSTHDAPDTSRKGARTAWWEARAALDARLKDLLVNIESIWLGGFRGIFGHNVGSLDLLSRFQQSLNNILDKHLPSRQKQTKAKDSDRVTLDLHVLELFVTLGNPNEREIDEELLDLLYFVIDILQFHGERNAYDEVDFDAMTIELLDSLRQYHETAKDQDSASSSQHTILILDKALHCFPWESLPCLKGQAVSRLPSLGSLRDRILQQTKQQQVKADNSVDPMFTIRRSDGAYVLNPGGDLVATQSRFEEPLQKLADWDAITNREPSEADIKMALESRDIFLYFGHGSGSQYIRSRTIQKLEKCAVALLMGCSSGAVTEAGEFESYGTPINYMQAGCPAVLATLWDVTDKDIDRFSQTVLEKWGLFEEPQPDVSSSPVKKGGKSRDKAKGRKARNLDIERRSLDQAVAESRDSCIMKYLNGAAPVIYGVPRWNERKYGEALVGVMTTAFYAVFSGG